MRGGRSACVSGGWSLYWPANVTVVEGGSATFSVQLARTSGAAYQWIRHGTNIPGATASSYTLAPVRLTCRDVPASWASALGWPTRRPYQATPAFSAAA